MTSKRSCFSAAAGVDSLRHFWCSFWLFSRSGDIFAHFIPLGVVVPLQYVCAILPESHTHRQAGRQHTNQPTSNLHNAHVPLHRSLFFARGCLPLARFLSLSSSPGRSPAPFWWVDKGKDEFPEEMTCQSETENEPPQIASFVFGDLPAVARRLHALFILQPFSNELKLVNCEFASRAWNSAWKQCDGRWYDGIPITLVFQFQVNNLQLWLRN